MLQRFGELAPERAVKFALVNMQTVEADGTFSGYAMVRPGGSQKGSRHARRLSGERLGGAEEIAAATLYLASDEARCAVGRCSPPTEAGPRRACGGQILGERD
jgi:NAD(P)-dependent dehydrogenase (short-subunit alcohol dehydrogenase family)